MVKFRHNGNVLLNCKWKYYMNIGKVELRIKRLGDLPDLRTLIYLMVKTIIP